VDKQYVILNLIGEESHKEEILRVITLRMAYLILLHTKKYSEMVYALCILVI